MLSLPGTGLNTNTAPLLITRNLTAIARETLLRQASGRHLPYALRAQFQATLQESEKTIRHISIRVVEINEISAVAASYQRLKTMTLRAAVPQYDL